MKKQLIRYVMFRGESHVSFFERIGLLTLFSLIATFIILTSPVRSDISESASLDSIKLIYNDINADSFPKIISLVTVTNETGYIIDKLDENNFEVREDGIRELPIEVKEVTDAKTAINVALVIDRSGSMRGDPIADAKQASITFVDLMQGEDKSAVISFSYQSRTDCPFSTHKDSLKAAISSLRAHDGTAVFDAVIHAVNLITDDLQNRAIILLTDGEDNSSKHTYQETLAACLAHELRVFAIGLGLKVGGATEQVLKDLAKKTGGLYYYSPTSNELEEIYRMISKLLHHRYQVSYSTHNPAKDGTFRHVQIDVILNTKTSMDTASYRAPYEPEPVAFIEPVDPEPVEHQFEVLPNPFTPNNDGFNDWVEFRKGDESLNDWDIAILDRSGRLIRRLNHGERIWDGKDKSGKFMFPGFYLYIVSNRNYVIHRGLIQLIR